MKSELYRICMAVENMHELLETLVARQQRNPQCCRAVCLSDAEAAGLAPSETAAEEPQATPLYNRKEAAEYLLVDPRTVTRYRINGRLGFIQDGDGRIRYPEDALKACYHWKWGRLPSD